jgi:DNA-binding XRE family transcriptional regulator
MAINSKDRFALLPTERQKAIQARAKVLIAEEMTLGELREARRRSQAELAKELGVQQAAISRLERRTDMYLSTLRNLIEAMGGKLEIVAQFPGRPPIHINQFNALDQAK